MPRCTWLPRILSTFSSMSLSIMIDSPARRVSTSIAYPSLSSLDVLSRDPYLTSETLKRSVKPMYVSVRRMLQIDGASNRTGSDHGPVCDDGLVFYTESCGS